MTVTAAMILGIDLEQAAKALVFAALAALVLGMLFPALVTRTRLKRLGATVGTPIVTGLAVSLGVLAIQLYFDARAKERDERRSLQVELGRDTELIGADLAGRDLNGFFLQRKQFNGANLVGATLEEANLRRASLVGANLAGANLRGADLTDTQLQYANLEDADLTSASLELAQLPQARAQRATFVGARLSLAWLPADLRDADFTRAELVNAALDGANLRRATFVGADVDGASFRGAQLAGADFTGAKNMQFADFSDATYVKGTATWATDWGTFRPDGFGACRSTCTVTPQPKQSFRDISSFLDSTKKLLEKRWLPKAKAWESRDDRLGFTFSAPLRGAEITGENHTKRESETIAAFANDLRPLGLRRLRDEWTAPVRVRGSLDGCLHGYTWEAAGRVRRSAIDLYFFHGRYGFLFSVKADSAVFRLYGEAFRTFFETLEVSPNPFPTPVNRGACGG